MPNKEPEFTVTDRRKFTTEGELRPEAKQEDESNVATKPVDTVQKPPSEPRIIVPEEAAQTTPPEAGAVPEHEAAEQPAPSAAEQQAQHDAYQQSNSTLDSQLRSQLGGQRVPEFEMNFERLAASMYMTALMQLGLDQQSEQRRVDIIGARQTIDTLGLLQDKTRGNLTPAEENLLRNCLYELRMAYVETMDAIARSAQAGPEPGKA